MSKELEALESMKNRLIDARFTVNGTTLYSKDKSLDDDYKLLCKALQRLESIDNSKPSEALECLESEKKIMWAYDYDIIKNALIKAQEMEKALADVEKVKSGKTIIHIGKDLVMMNKAKYYEYLENENEPVSKRILQAKVEELEKALKIIKEKNVDVYALVNQYDTVEEYNQDLRINPTYYCYSNCKKLTKEEFKLIKEVLEDDR